MAYLKPEEAPLPEMNVHPKNKTTTNGSTTGEMDDHRSCSKAERRSHRKKRTVGQWEGDDWSCIVRRR